MAKKNRGKKRGKGRKKEPTLYDLAIKLVTRGYAPAIKQARGAVQNAMEHMEPGGALDQAYDRSGQSIAAAQQFAVNNANAQAQTSRDATQAVAGEAAALGAEQAAYASQQAQLYGQTADAALEATRRQGAHVGALGQAGGNQAGFLAALGAIQGNLGVSNTLANEGRRGEARTEVLREVGRRRDSLDRLRAERGAEASGLAQDLQQQENEYLLALETLGLKERDSRRDFRATLRGIAAQERMNTADNRTTERGQDVTSSDKAADRQAKYDMDGDGDIDAKDKRIAARHKAQGGSGTGAGRYTATVRVGPKGTTINVTPAQKRKYSEGLAKWQDYYDKAAAAFGSGKYKNAEEARRASGGQRYGDSTLWEIAWVARSNRGGGPKNIPERYRAALRRMFPGGKIPYKIARAIGG